MVRPIKLISQDTLLLQAARWRHGVQDSNAHSFEPKALLSKQLSQGERGLGRNTGHFAKTIIREILRLAFFDGLQNEAGDEFGLVTLRILS
jgi:hypothetical protein